MKEFFKNLNYPIILFVLYVLKSIILPAGYVDVAMVLVLAAFYLIKDFGAKYMEARVKVVTEAVYRAKTEEALGALAAEVSAVRMSAANPLQGFGRKR